MFEKIKIELKKYNGRKEELIIYKMNNIEKRIKDLDGNL
jgi:hypothetical protein